jgi:hypothetical protein
VGCRPDAGAAENVSHRSARGTNGGRGVTMAARKLVNHYGARGELKNLL